MATEDRIQPPGANPPAAATTAVTKAPTAPVPAPKTKNPVADRFAEMWQGLKPYLTRRVLYVVVALALIVGGYFIFMEYRRRSTNDNSEGWVKWLMLSDPTEVRGAAEKVKAAEKGKPGWTPPGPESPNYNEYSVAVQRQLLDDFAKSVPDTTQARVAQMQLGRFLMSRAMPAIGLNAGIEAVAACCRGSANRGRDLREARTPTGGRPDLAGRGHSDPRQGPRNARRSG